MIIAVSGASGQLGRLIVARLKERIPAAEIVALARDPAKVTDLGVTARLADYERPETLGPALAGVETLMMVSSSEVGRRAAQHRNVIEAARAAGVGRIVYTSLLRADVSPISLADEHRATEAELKASGIPVTILRNGWYAENHTGGLAGALAGGAVVGSAGDGRFATATRDDLAAAAVEALVGQGHEGRTYELGGDEAYTLSELAAEVSRQTGRTIPYKDLPQAEYAALLTGFGLPVGLAQGLAAWDVDASRGALFDDSRQLSRLIGRPTTPLAHSVAKALQALG